MSTSWQRGSTITATNTLTVPSVPTSVQTPGIDLPKLTGALIELEGSDGQWRVRGAQLEVGVAEAAHLDLQLICVGLSDAKKLERDRQRALEEASADVRDALKALYELEATIDDDMEAIIEVCSGNPRFKVRVVPKDSQ